MLYEDFALDFRNALVAHCDVSAAEGSLSGVAASATDQEERANTTDLLMRAPAFALGLILEYSSLEALGAWRVLSSEARESARELALLDSDVFCNAAENFGPRGAPATLRVIDLRWAASDRTFELSTLSPMRELRRCRVERARGAGDLGALSRLTRLERLCLSGCSDARGSIEALTALTSLVRLNLSGCRAVRGSLEPLAALGALEVLNLSWAQGLRGSVAPLATLDRLRHLDLDWCLNLSGDVHHLFKPLAALKQLSVVQALRLTGVPKLRAERKDCIVFV